MHDYLHRKNIRVFMIAFQSFRTIFNVSLLQEPRCRICARLASAAAFNPYTPENRYKSPVIQRREYCDPRCSAKIGTDMKPELDSRSYHVDRLVNKLQELNRNVQDLDESKHYDRMVIN